MKAIYNILSQYFKSYFHLPTYLSIGLVLIGLIGLNYYFNFEDTYIDTIQSSALRFGAMFLFQLLPYLLSIGILLYFNRIKNPLKNGQFWLLMVFGFALLALDRSISFSHVIHENITNLHFSYSRKVANFLSGVLFIVFPLILFAIVSKDKHHVYGLFGRFKGIKPYAFLLFGSFICVFIGGFFSDIQSYYPLYLQDNPNYFQQETQYSTLYTILLYELSYALSFISVEFFFRGFLIFAFIKHLGKYAVLPMAVTYCVLHFGKPMTEAISSVFGGLLLGIIALKHKNIRGGILIHVGMAWSMELIGYLHRII